jgi:hypothetical protein
VLSRSFMCPRAGTAAMAITASTAGAHTPRARDEVWSGGRRLPSINSERPTAAGSRAYTSGVRPRADLRDSDVDRRGTTAGPWAAREQKSKPLYVLAVALATRMCTGERITSRSITSSNIWRRPACVNMTGTDRRISPHLAVRVQISGTVR